MGINLNKIKTQIFLELQFPSRALDCLNARDLSSLDTVKLKEAFQS